MAFLTGRKQPPKIWNLPKHYLDLLGETTAPPDDPGTLLFEDDRSVKMLYASCDNLWPIADGDVRPRIAIEAMSRAAAISEMELAFSVATGAKDRGRGWLLEDHEANDLARDECEASLRNADQFALRDELSRDVANLMRYHALQAWQNMFLRGNDIWLRYVFFGNGRDLLTAPRRREQSPPSPALKALLSDFGALPKTTSAAYRDGLLSGLLRMAFPPLPQRVGESAAFRAGVRDACKAFLERYPRLFPLLVPLSVTVLVVPPKRAKALGKDLDNILIDVLGIVDEEWKPPAVAALRAPRLPLPKHEPDELEWLREWWAAQEKRIKSLGDTAIHSYQILELRRRPEDPPEGSLLLDPGHGETKGSLWAQADEYLQEHLDRER